MPSSSSSVEPDHGAALPRQGDTEGVVSFLRTQHDVDAVCGKYGVPKDRYPARPAGDLRASSPPPAGCVCVYADALEAGMRVPLHGFFCDVLAHFGIAPTQLAPNGWRIMAGFLVLCHSAAVPPSLPVFRYFFLLCVLSHKHKGKGCYFFRSRDTSGLRFKGMPSCIKDWKNSFFFLSSPEPWPFPVEWGEPSKRSFMEPVLNSEGKKHAAKLLRTYAGATVDIDTCLSDSNLAAAMASAASPPPPPPPPPSSFTRISTDSKGMDPSVYKMMKNMLAEKAANQASAPAKKLKAEPGSHAPGPSPLCAKKRNLEEVTSEEGPPRSLLNKPLSGMSSPPPGFPISHDGDGTDWEAARELLQGAVAPPQHRVFAASEPSDVVASSYVAILQAANYVSSSLGYALELEEKLAARDAEVAALEKQLSELKSELAAARAERDGARGARAAARGARAGALEER